MQFYMRMMGSLVFITIIMSLTVTGTHGEKVVGCCTEVSTQNITGPITGYRLQRRSLPCVKAVIFYTEEGHKCSHWREQWVRERIQELNKLKEYERAGKKLAATTSAPIAEASP